MGKIADRFTEADRYLLDMYSGADGGLGFICWQAFYKSIDEDDEHIGNVIDLLFKMEELVDIMKKVRGASYGDAS